MTAEPQDHWITTDRGRLFARSWRADDGSHDATLPPLLLFHDSLGCVELWRDFPQVLAQASARTIIAYDRLGFGRSAARSDRLPASFVGDESANVIAELQTQLGFDRFVAFGHSVGGGMAIACAAALPQYVAALVTESAQIFVEDRTRRGIEAAKIQFAAPGQLRRLEKYHGDKAAWVLSAWIDTWLSDGFAAWNLDAELSRLRCPMLALHGDGDEYGSVLHPQRIARFAPHSKVQVLAGCGHVPHREQAEDVMRRVQAFLHSSAAAA